MKIPVPNDEKGYYKEIYGLTHSPDMKSMTLKLAHRMADKYESLTLINQLTYFHNRNKDYAVVIPSINEVADKFNAIKSLKGVLVIEIEINGDTSILDVGSVYIIRRKPAVATFESVPVEYNGEVVSGLLSKTKEEETVNIQTAMTAEEKDFYIKQHSGRYKSNPISNGDSKLTEFHKRYGVNDIVSQHQIDKHDVNVHYAVVNIRKNVVADEIVGIGGRYSGRDDEGYYRTGVGVKVNGEIEKWLSCDIFVTERDYEKPPVTTFNGLEIGIGGGKFNLVMTSDNGIQYKCDAEDNSVRAELGKLRNSIDELEDFLESMGLKTGKSEIKGGKIVSEANSWISSMGLGDETAYALLTDSNTVVSNEKNWEKRAEEVNNALYSGLKMDNIEQKEATSPIDTVTGILHKSLRKSIAKCRPTLLDLTKYNGVVTQDELDTCMKSAIKMIVDNPINSRSTLFALIQPPSLAPIFASTDRSNSLINMYSKDLLPETINRAGLWRNRQHLISRSIVRITTHANYYINETKTYGDNIMFGVKF